MSMDSFQVSPYSPSTKGKQSTSEPSGRQVLIVGSESAVLNHVRDVLVHDKLPITLLTKEQALIRLQKGFVPDVILLQVVAGQTLETLTTLRTARPTVPIIAFSCSQDMQFVVTAMKTGASDYIQLPFNMDGLKASVRHFLSPVGDGQREGPAHETPLSENASFVCASARMNEIRGQCAILARVDLPILILGESGTGKEIIAQYIHKMSLRGHRTFLKVNCAAMPADLLESELFGYEQGAFTGAVKSKPGKFEICNMGMILLDEIGEMPPPLQSKLLQVLQDGTFSRLGGRTSIKVDVRVVAATNIDMNAAIAAKTFREDLYYRLNGFCVQLPPLRERKEEIPILIRHFMSKLSAKYARQPLTISELLLRACMEHDWPGNLRELESFIKRFLVLGDEQRALSDLRNARGNRSAAAPRTSLEVDSVGGLKRLAQSAKGEAEAEAMREVLNRHNWNRKHAATELQISYKALLYKIRQYGLSPTQVSEPNNKTAAQLCMTMKDSGRSKEEAEKKHKVVISRQDGTVIKGYVYSEVPVDLNSLPGNLQFHFHEMLETCVSEDGTQLDVNWSQVKAFFFVSSFEGDRDYKSVRFSSSGPEIKIIWVEIVFQDGEVVEGYMSNSLHHLKDDGFFLCPSTPGSNNLLIYVNKSAIVSYRVLGLPHDGNPIMV